MQTVADKLSDSATRIITQIDAHARRNRPFYTALALLIFVSGILISLVTTPIPVERIQPLALVANALIGAPIALAVNALGLVVSARVLSTKMSFRVAFQTCSLASASSVLPIPAGAYFQASALTRAGGGPLASGGLTVLTNFALLTILALLAGLAWAPAFPFLGVSLSLFGFASTLAIWLLIARTSNARIAAIFLALRAMRAAVLLTRIWLSFLMIGATLSILDAAAFSLAVSIGTSVSFIPAGLGVSESIASAIAQTLSAEAGIAFLAIASNRIITLVASGSVAFVMLQSERKGNENAN